MGASRSCAFGKVPHVGDFIRARADHGSVVALESWVTDGMGMAHMKRRSWASDFGRGAANAFVYRPPAKTTAQDTIVVGVLRPSHDAVGRLFPLMFGATTDAAPFASAPHLLPLVLGDFLEHAGYASIRADAIQQPQQLEQHVSQLHPPMFDARSAWDDYAAFAHGTSIAAALGAVYGDAWFTRAPHAIHTIIQAVEPVRGREPPDTRLSLRLPLGSAGSAAAAFWLDVVRAAARWQRTVPSFFWCADGGSLLLQLGDTPAASLSELWSPDENADLTCDLVNGQSTVDPNRTLESLPRNVAAALHAQTTSVGAFVTALAQS